MLVVVSYDVATSTEGGKRRLRRVAKECLNYGQRVQNSVFECLVDPKQFEKLKHKLLLIANEEMDSIRFYFLGDNWKSKIQNYGRKHVTDLENPIIL